MIDDALLIISPYTIPDDGPERPMRESGFPDTENAPTSGENEREGCEEL